MKEYDVVVIGDGSGSSIVQTALNHGSNVALIDKPPIGGTCQNYGCIPSKMLIYPADIVAEIQNAKKLGVYTEITDIDFKSIMERMRRDRKESQEYQQNGIKNVSNLDYYPGECFFIDDYTLSINNEKVKGKKIFIATGARPLIPPINGIDDVDYLTNETLLELEERPKSLIIIGGGYIAVEYAHFFSAMGTKVTILERENRLVASEEPEISKLLEKELMKRMSVYTGVEVVEINQDKDLFKVKGEDKENKEKEWFSSQKVLIAAGRKSNADILKVSNTGVDVNSKGYIKVNDFFETTKNNIWAFGDAIGKQMFKHVANEEALIVGNNGFHDEKMKMRYHAAPHAVFSYPQIASVGLTQQEAKNEGHDLLIGSASYDQVAKGIAMMESNGFAKAIVDKNDLHILGFHIIGPYAPILIQEVITIMEVKGQVGHLGQAMHIHPALPELIQRTLGNLKEV